MAITQSGGSEDKVDMAFFVLITSILMTILLGLYIHKELTTDYDCDDCRDRGYLVHNTGIGGSNLYYDCLSCDKYDFEGFKTKTQMNTELGIKVK